MLEGRTCHRRLYARRWRSGHTPSFAGWLVWQDSLSSFSPLPPLLFKYWSSFRCDWKRAVNRLRVWNALLPSAETQGRRWHVSDMWSVWYQRQNCCLKPLEGLGKASVLSTIIQQGDNVYYYLKRYHWQSDVIFTYRPFFENQTLFCFICLTIWLAESASSM